MAARSTTVFQVVKPMRSVNGGRLPVAIYGSRQLGNFVHDCETESQEVLSTSLLLTLRAIGKRNAHDAGTVCEAYVPRGKTDGCGIMLQKVNAANRFVSKESGH